MWIQTAAIVFALVFFVVGVLRTVEFSGLGLPRMTRGLLVSAHVLGCALFSSALAQVALDTHEVHRTRAFMIFIAALVFLCPGQVTIALRRREASEENSGKPRKS